MQHLAIVLFAQGKGGGADGGMVFALLLGCLQLVFAGLAIALAVYGLITVYRALNAVSPRNRDMEPGMIFLLFIPCFNLIWYILVVLRVASSLRKEFDDRGIREEGDFGQLLGLLGLVPCIGFIFQVMYILKIKAYTEQLTSGGKRRGKLDDEDDDDRPRRGRRRDEDDEE